MTEREKKMAKSQSFPISWAMFCGEVSMNEMYWHIEKEFELN